MDSRSDIREFLTSRRARLTPAEAGLPNFGGQRRVAGLRREEVALLAGMSVEYYVRLERGNALGVSEQVLDGISRALQLDDAEHAHLFDLVRAANAGAQPTRRRAPATQHVRPATQQLIDAMTDVPAIVQNGRLDILASNRLGRALFAEIHALQPPNFARYVFLGETAPDLYRDWEDAAQQTVALLRAEAGRVPRDRALSALVGELSTGSQRFAELWASHDVREHRTGVKLMRHPVVGDLDLSFEGLGLSTDPGLLLIAYSAEPGSPTHERLQLLSNLTATAKTTPAQ